MRGNPDASVRSFLARLGADERGRVEELRELVLSSARCATETVLWGALSYHKAREGGRVKGAICLIEVKRGRIRLGFIHGASLSDPRRLLSGSGVAKRWIEVRPGEPLQRAALRELVRSAVAYRPGGVC